MKQQIAQARLRRLANPAKARVYQRFFKTGPGDYGEGDRFLGLTVPQLRNVARNFSSLPLRSLHGLLQSPIHEDRLLALLVLVEQFDRAPGKPARRGIYEFYLAHTHRINNWDLVDLSAARIVGPYLSDRDKTPLYLLAVSDVLWERRVAMVACYYFIKRGRFRESLKVARLLLRDSEDLIHKAVGWMLREVGKKDRRTLEQFLRPRYRRMPRTMLRYAIERFPKSVRQRYLRGKI